jgi:hypothetical protein
MQSADRCNRSKQWWPEVALPNDMGNTSDAKSDDNIKSMNNKLKT